MHIRKTTEEDKVRRQEIFDIGVKYQKEHGNPNQWKPGYPGEALLDWDIQSGNGYVVELDGRIVGTFSLIPGEDPTYGYIEGGAWKSAAPYAAIHRVASDGTMKGIGDVIMRWCIEQAGHVRIDTHRDNKTMQHVILKNGFEYCGIIYLKNGEQRLAYEYTGDEHLNLDIQF